MPSALCRGAAAAALAAAVLAAPEIALATTDTTFDEPLDTVEDIVGGTGQLAAALVVGAALVGSVLRFNAMQFMGAVGVGIAAGAGTGIVTGLVGTATGSDKGEGNDPQRTPDPSLRRGSSAAPARDRRHRPARTAEVSPQQDHDERKDDGSRTMGKRTILSKARQTVGIPLFHVSVDMQVCMPAREHG